eukprot:6096-Heterococcus_DN1.PRE.3
MCTPAWCAASTSRAEARAPMLILTACSTATMSSFTWTLAASTAYQTATRQLHALLHCTYERQKQVVDSSLDSIKRALDPSFTPDAIAALDSNTTLARDQYGVAYLPGFVGLNNLTCTDYVNVTLHALAHVPPLRDFFLVPANYASSKSPLVRAFGEVMRRLWSKDNFKSAVSPHEFLQAVSIASDKKFRVGQQAECIDFMAWLLNALHLGLGGSKRKAGTSVIHKTFQGLVHVHTSTRVKRRALAAAEAAEGEGADETAENETVDDAVTANASAEEDINGDIWESNEADIPFLHLQLDIPNTPLFKDSQGGNIIPQVSIFTALAKFDGATLTDIVKGGQLSRRRYSLKRLPPYLILHLARFTRNNFFVEKNPTIVNFPVKNLELRDYLAAEAAAVPDTASMSVKQLQQWLSARSIAHSDAVERDDLEQRVHSAAAVMTKYDLVANICHDSPAGQGKEGQMDPLQ